ncbi:TetR/AcrR family transcriptional regulator [Stackebrandtia nassauensis]|uniref:Transcriptional regulator, TetR family n=1 Tax=Stackebrandtia nassauensis (strain DSM 44728 / CIP 108903 / NRRL B-16338 / NBRC 102104 / LLR-40K-21) TaxID=446470 RepID=D3Q7P0_STANL|nr:TetR/AcrR family transcriptional regulator [Stackebrandtia nassauensis]ADD44382.1 transcriptional regulator, TetR family [Stackebrandtia nassauensis DSM 44728]
MSESAKSRRRGAELVNAIHEAAIDELNEVGIGRLTMEGIARRSGAAKTSLYRRWPDTHALLIEALRERMPQETPSPGADDLRGDLIAALQLLCDWMMTPAARAVSAIVAGSGAHPEFTKRVFEEVFEAKGSRFTLTVLRHYADRGEIDPERVTPVVADIGEALVFKFSMDRFAMPAESDLAAIVDEAILPALGLGR